MLLSIVFIGYYNVFIVVVLKFIWFCCNLLVTFVVYKQTILI